MTNFWTEENSYVERNNNQSETVSYMVGYTLTAITVRNGMLKLQLKFNLLCVCLGNIAKDQTFPLQSLSEFVKDWPGHASYLLNMHKYVYTYN